ncbi:hypothetical protein AALO_G00132020 [Alosa alosa]|uniref:SPATA31 domain-containing protein n=1 Tax=Alosa alosa TaxID=278164 RepID=A0AAV6GR62_9TELE|nr:hypothetical protein AALO_G00132020 [Alosa alosa]
MRERSVCSGCAPPRSCLLTPQTLVILQALLCLLSLVLILSWSLRRCKVKQRLAEIKGEDSVNQIVLHPKENPEKTSTLCTCVHRYSETAQTLVLQSEASEQEYSLRRLCHLQYEDPDAAGSLSDQNKCSSCIKSLAERCLCSECTSRQACASDGKTPIIPCCGTLEVAESRDVNVLRSLVCRVWRYILQILHTIIGMFLCRMLVAFTDSTSGTPRMKSPRLIGQNYGSLEVKKSSIEMNLRQKHLEHLLGAFTAFKQSMERLAPEPSSPTWLRRAGEESDLELTGAETLFLSQETRDKLEFNVKNKLMQRLWGLPVVVQRSQSSVTPQAPELRARTLLPEPACPGVQVTSCQAPVLTEEQQCKLSNCVSHKQDAKSEGYPEKVTESLQPFEMPESMLKRLRRGDVTGQAEDAAEATSAKKKKGRGKEAKRGSVSHQIKPPSKKRSKSTQD